MTKPYVANLIIDFKIKKILEVDENIPAPVVEIDQITGNPIINTDPITGNPIEDDVLYRVSAHIEGVPSILQEIGSNPNIVQVSGKIVETWNNEKERWENYKILPVGIIRYQSEAIAVYIDAASGFDQPCFFTLEPDIDKRRPRVARRLVQRLGSPIKGTLRF